MLLWMDLNTHLIQHYQPSESRTVVTFACYNSYHKKTVMQLYFYTAMYMCELCPHVNRCGLSSANSIAQF